jgi:hypothetical protein
MLHKFIAANLEEILARIRERATSGPEPRAIRDEPNDGLAIFLDQMVETLGRPDHDRAAMGESASKHGGDQLRLGFTVGHVVHGYGDVLQAVTELAKERRAPITIEEFQIFNRCLDQAIARAVTEYVRQQPTVSDTGTERLGRIAHELRNSLSGALLAFDILKRGNVGVGGEIGTLLGRSLLGLRDIVHLSFAEVRLEQNEQKQERMTVSDLVREVESDSATRASTAGVLLGADRQIAR